MKVIKPQKLSILHRPFEAGGKLRLCVTAMLAAPFAAPESPVHEATLWKMLAAHLGRDVPPDLCMPKPRAEVLVAGCAYPRNPPQVACSVRLTMGPIDKTLWVVGDRAWNRAGVATDPAPFTAMPITWGNAFGGAGFAANPLGKGLAPVKTEAGEAHPLPNVEDPKRLVRSRGDRPPPAGFGPYDLTWPERYSKVGTYDHAWLKNQYPGLPLDFDFEFYNSAPLDQRLDGHFKGDETFALENMHPTRPVLTGRLPRFASRVFLGFKGGEFREVPMRMDTLQLFPEALTMLVLYRGATEIVEDDASDVLQLVAACDAAGALRPIEHYQAVLEERLDKKRAALASLRESDLMPPGPGAAVAITEIADPDLASESEFLRRKNSRRKNERELEAARERLRAAGLNPDERLPQQLPPEPPTSIVTLDEAGGMITAAREHAVEARAEGARQRAKAEAEARRLCQGAGKDYDAILAEQKAKAGGPPKFSATALLRQMRELAADARRAGHPKPALEAKLAQPDLREKLEQAEQSLRKAYRKSAHLSPAAPVAAAALTERARIELPAGAQGGVSFAERDLTGVDLSGLDMHGVDLTAAFLEGADLTGADLSGADLTRAVLTRAKLDGANLSGAKLAGCNLGRASLVGAKVEGDVDMTGAILTGANLTRASFRGAHLGRADLGEATFHETDFSGVTARNILFNKTDLRGLKLTGASLHKCNFLEVELSGVDLSGADLTSSAFLGVKAAGAAFRGARMHKVRAVQGSVFDGADFSGATLLRANLRGMSLVGCNFTGAELDGADLSECDLREAVFYRALARGARFVKADLSRANLIDTNLMLALMDRAKLRGANLTGANLFRADLCRVDVDRGTITKEANLRQIRFVQRKPSPGEPPAGIGGPLGSS